VKQKPERRKLGCLGALLGVLPAAPLAWVLTRSGLLTGLVGLTGFLLGLGGWRLLAGRSSGLGIGLSALLTPLAALPGLYLGYAELIQRENERYGCTLAEALELVPMVALDPGNRAELLWALGGLIFMDLLCALLAARYLRLRRAEQINKR
jgi:hypothetical protein